MSTTRNKAWNGRIDTLKAEYLTEVLGRMATYGDRAQFKLGTSDRPHYQVINAAGKKMAFDSNHHLLHAEPDAFLGSNATGIYTLEQVKAAMTGGSVKTHVAATRAASSGSRGGSAAAKAAEALALAKYEYFKNNRQALPPEIGQHSDAITLLMKQGMSAEEAFGAIVREHF